MPLPQPRQCWKDAQQYDEKARHLAALFRDNFETYADQMSEAVRQAEPRG